MHEIERTENPRRRGKKVRVKKKVKVRTKADFRASVNGFIRYDEARLKGTDAELGDVMDANIDFIQRKMTQNPEYFKRTGKAQAPNYLYIGCSDARVNPNQIMQLDNDELFVTRNIGNQVAPGDLNILSVLEFSLGYLKIPHIVVCGHTECGAVKGALTRQKDGGLGFLEHWLRHLRDTARTHHRELKDLKTDKEKQDRFAELNAIEQCLNVLKTPIVQKLRSESFKETGYVFPRVHGVVYDVRCGRLKKLDLNFNKDIKEMREIYDLYQGEDDTKKEFWDVV